MTEQKGHNSISADEIKSLVERVCRLEDERKVLGEDVRELYLEAKSKGFDTKMLRKAVRFKQKGRAAVIEEREMEELYLHALGFLD
jgi:uncharacterized protein (UPF0335 family)